MKNISFIITNYNTKQYTEWSYNAIRNNLSNSHEIVMIDDGSSDGTWELLNQLKDKDSNLIIHRNETNIGIAYSYNKAVELSTNEVICLIHSDIYLPPNFDTIMLSELDNFDFVTCLRIEPPVYPQSTDKLLINYGMSLEDFKEQRYLNEYQNHITDYNQLRTCFPWLCKKSTYQKVNGIDCLFLKYMVDDDDFYLRLAKEGFSYIQTFKTNCYHLCSRTTKYKDDILDLKGNKDWNKQYNKSTRNFIRKWGLPQSYVYKEDNSINTNIEKYLTELQINCEIDYTQLMILEPFLDSIKCKNSKLIEDYIKFNQKETLINLKDKFDKYIDNSYLFELNNVKEIQTIINNRIQFALIDNKNKININYNLNYE